MFVQSVPSTSFLHWVFQDVWTDNECRYCLQPWCLEAKYIPNCCILLLMTISKRISPKDKGTYQESTSQSKIRLVVWNMAFIFPYIGNNHPNWLSYFSEGLKPPTRKWLTCVSFTERANTLILFLQWITKARISKMMFKTMMARVYGEHKTTICVTWKWKSHRNRCWSVDRPWLGLIHSYFIYIYIYMWLSWSRLNMAMSCHVKDHTSGWRYIYNLIYIYIMI
jgi:hypothetical protein